MKKQRGSIESNIKLIAIVGGLLFITLVGTLITVQQSLGSSQKKLAETVVPVQQRLGELSAVVGSIFLRQSEIIAANEEELKQLGDNDRQEEVLRTGQANFNELITASGLSSEEGFPVDAARDLKQEVDRFLIAEKDLYGAAQNYQSLKREFALSIDAIEKDLRALIETSGGLAGVLRLEHVSHLRRLSKKLDQANVPAELLRPVLTGSSRLQLDTISQLDAAVLHLGVLAGKVGLAASDDALNSLAANELIQNREHILSALEQLERLVSDAELADRVRNLRTAAVELAARVGDESLASSLLSMHRSMLREEREMRQSQVASAIVSDRLEESTTKLRNYLQLVADRAQGDAAITIRRSQQVTVAISIVTIVLAIMAGFRVYSSVVALRLQNKQLSELSEELVRTNAGLEKTVADRTASLQLVLDSTGDGMLSTDLRGVLLPERSRSVTNWFGESSPGATLWDYLADSQATRDALAMAIEQLAEDVFPFDVSADQAPKTLQRNGCTYALEYREIREHGKLARILVLVRDVTAELEAKRAEKEMRELHTLVGNLLRDRNGFDQTLDECASLVSEIAQAVSRAVAQRDLHTLKGNCAIVGFQSVADYVHELEEMLIDEQREPTREEVVDLDRRWQSSLQKIRTYLDTGREGQIEISNWEYELVQRLLDQRARHTEILRFVDSWQHEPTAAPLSRLGEQAKQVAKRFGKEIEVTVDDDHLRIPDSRLRRFWTSMIHVVRNAVDHGVEMPEQRLQAGKPAVARLHLASRVRDGLLEIEVADDGRGIDWNRLRSIAEKRGMRCETQDELVEILFADGVTTCDVATDISGRGVGLSAVRAECRKAGGDVRVESLAGKGTRFVFQFPAKELCEV